MGGAARARLLLDHRPLDRPRVVEVDHERDRLSGRERQIHLVHVLVHRVVHDRERHEHGVFPFAHDAVRHSPHGRRHDVRDPQIARRPLQRDAHAPRLPRGRRLALRDQEIEPIARHLLQQPQRADALHLDERDPVLASAQQQRVPLLPLRGELLLHPEDLPPADQRSVVHLDRPAAQRPQHRVERRPLTEEEPALRERDLRVLRRVEADGQELRVPLCDPHSERLQHVVHVAHPEAEIEAAGGRPAPLQVRDAVLEHHHARDPRPVHTADRKAAAPPRQSHTIALLRSSWPGRMGSATRSPRCAHDPIRDKAPRLPGCSRAPRRLPPGLGGAEALRHHPRRRLSARSRRHLRRRGVRRDLRLLRRRLGEGRGLRQPPTGGGGSGGEGGGSGGEGGCAPLVFDHAGETIGCQPDLQSPDCPIAAAEQCAESACLTDCSDFYLCKEEGWVALAYCDENGNLFEAPR